MLCSRECVPQGYLWLCRRVCGGACGEVPAGYVAAAWRVWRGVLGVCGRGTANKRATE